MSDESDFIPRLLRFGLTEKEARLYFRLLKYGPKSPSPLAKALHTYREDIHRTLQSLIDKGMVRPSLGSPTVYAAVELEVALESALKKHDSELRDMRQRKRELQDLARQQLLPSDETGKFKVLKNVKDIVAQALPIIQSTKREFLFVTPKEGFLAASRFGITEAVEQLVRRGGHARGITHINDSMRPHIQKVLAAGEEIRHFEGYRGMYYVVFDRKYCISAINIDVGGVKPHEPASMLFADDPVYAKYLVSTFEFLWKQSIPAQERISSLLSR